MFTDQERRVYRRHADGREYYADPLAVHRAFVQALDGDPDSVLQAAQRPAQGVEEPTRLLQRLEAERRIAEAGRTALGLQPFDAATGRGTTDAEALEAAYDFLEWLEGNAARAVG